MTDLITRLVIIAGGGAAVFYAVFALFVWIGYRRGNRSAWGAVAAGALTALLWVLASALVMSF